LTATLFFRLLKEDDKDERLRAAVQGLRTGGTEPLLVHRVEQETFRMIPGAPFAYWVSEAMRRKFIEFSRLENGDRVARRGPSTGDDFWRVRASWEVPVHQVPRTFEWVTFSKGGEFSPFYADIYLLVAWDADISSFVGFLGRPGRMSPKLEARNYFLRPGLTWPRRTTSGISFRALPAGSIFADKGPVLFTEDRESLALLLALCNSRPFEGFVSLSLGAADVAARSYEVGIIQDRPVPEIGSDAKERLSSLARSIHDAKRSLDTATENSHAFVLPALLQRSGPGLAARLEAWNQEVAAAAEKIVAAQREIDETCYRLYGISAEDRATIEAELGTEVRGLSEPLTSVEAVAGLLSWALGVVLGRFDVRLATGAWPIPDLPDAFAPLPAGSPGMLPDGRVPASYPITVDDQGILVDDEGHADDLVGRIREVFLLLWSAEADAVEKEACVLLGVRSLRDYVGRTGKGGFWDDHFRRYSKGRRRAPIYWLLQSPRGLYRIWLDALRLTKDTLPRVLGSRYLGARLAQVKHGIEDLRPGGEVKPGLTKKDERRLADLDELLLDLEELAAKLRAVMERTNDRGETVGYAPDLNDGVVLAAAALHDLIPWPKARQHGGRTLSELQAYWEELADGEYDWAQVARLYWPTRVDAKCRMDKSLALAHGLDAELFPGLREELRRQVEPSAEAKAEDEGSRDNDPEGED
jgi:hypothetical protein